MNFITLASLFLPLDKFVSVKPTFMPINYHFNKKIFLFASISNIMKRIKSKPIIKSLKRVLLLVE